MSASMKVDASGIRKIAARFSDSGLREMLMRVPQEKAVAALVGQAIADNFAQQGPGWPPLKASTIRRSVAKAHQKAVSEMSDEELVAHERKERAKGEKGNQYRMILQKTGLLKKTATIPGYSGSNKGATGRNIWKQEGTKLVWGTDLVYAGVHQKGDPKKRIPARPFLKLSVKWKKELQNYVVNRMFKYITEKIVGRR
jgi:phage gpG-like protein